MPVDSLVASRLRFPRFTKSAPHSVEFDKKVGHALLGLIASRPLGHDAFFGKPRNFSGESCFFLGSSSDFLGEPSFFLGKPSLFLGKPSLFLRELSFFP